MIRGTVIRTKDAYRTFWTAEVVDDEDVLLYSIDHPPTEDGRIAALTIAHRLVADARAVAKLVEKLDETERNLHYERTGACTACNATGTVDSSGLRCGWCDGKGYEVPPRIAELEAELAATKLAFSQIESNSDTACKKIADELLTGSQLGRYLRIWNILESSGYVRDPDVVSDLASDIVSVEEPS